MLELRRVLLKTIKVSLGFRSDAYGHVIEGAQVGVQREILGGRQALSTQEIHPRNIDAHKRFARRYPLSAFTHSS